MKPNFLESDPGARQRPGHYALFIGRFSPDKGLSTLLEAWSQVPKEFQLQIVGDGSEREQLEAEARQRGLDNIKFRGFLSREETLAALKNARLLVMPSLWYETFGMVIVEAFACGVPVICSRLGAMAELVQDRVSGLHFAPGDSADLARTLICAWNNPSALESMGRDARREFESHYTADKNYGMLMQVYEQAMQSRGRSRSLPATQESIQLAETSDVV